MTSPEIHHPWPQPGDEENARLRAIFPRILDALVNGSECDASCSIDLLESIPGQIQLTVARLTRERDDARRDAAGLRSDIARFRQLSSL